jgi:hypothetical protein
MKKFSFKYPLFLSLIILFVAGCQTDKNKDKEVFKEEKFNPNAYERAREFADKNPVTLFGGNKDKNTNFEFSTSNVLWRATLKSLDFLPLLNTDYSGGIIIYDWYSQTNNPKEQIKISVQFLNNELRSDSIKVTAHKKICETAERCSNSTLDQNFANSVKDSIIASARTLRIEEAKKEKK